MNVASDILITVGAAFLLLAAIGVVRLPDVFSRMHAGTKGASLGVACILAGTALQFPLALATFKLVAAILLQFLTAPVSAHIIGRTAYRAGVPLWEGTRYDELRDDV